jgi:hypothetical protein
VEPTFNLPTCQRLSPPLVTPSPAQRHRRRVMLTCCCPLPLAIIPQGRARRQPMRRDPTACRPAPIPGAAAGAGGRPARRDAQRGPGRDGAGAAGGDPGPGDGGGERSRLVTHGAQAEKPVTTITSPGEGPSRRTYRRTRLSRLLPCVPSFGFPPGFVFPLPPRRSQQGLSP